MSAEIIIVSGSLSGSRFGLSPGQTEIGRSPACTVAVPDSEVAWRHCVVQQDDGRYVLRDLNTSGGTYVNGMRVTTRSLENGDQISIGDSVLVFSDVAVAESPNSTRITLLRACTLLFLFRSLATSSSPAQTELLESHITGLLQELTRCGAGTVVLAGSEDELTAVVQEREAQKRNRIEGLDRMVQSALKDGPVVDRKSSCLVVPVYAAGAPRGLIAVRFDPNRSEYLEDYLEIVSAVSTLAASALESVREVQELKTENALLQERLTSDDFGVVGRSQSMKRLLQLAQRVAAQDTTVLILGDSGTGKELIARAVHQSSPRRDKPFVAINCAALTETLLESELFGHEKGAFTGAIAQKKGKLELGEGGTVFLDEIGELAPALQAKLLRVLQQREFERVGGTRTLPLDVRIVAATNRDLGAEVKRGRFREDLYHRLT